MIQVVHHPAAKELASDGKGGVACHLLQASDFAPLLDEPEVAKALLLAMCDRLRSAEARSAGSR